MRNLVIFCGVCNFPALYHTDSYRNQTPNGQVLEICERDWNTIGFWSDAYDETVRPSRLRADFAVDPNTGYQWLLPQVSGPEANDPNAKRSNEGYYAPHRFGVPVGTYDNTGRYLDEADYEPMDTEFAKLDRWRDLATTAAGDFICTPTLEQHRSPQMGSASEVTITFNREKHTATVAPLLTETLDTSERNAYIEGSDGFTSVQLLDEVLTRRYHARLLNVFRDKKTNDVRIGSIRLQGNVDGTKTITCVRNDCSTRLVVPANPDRATMESITWAIVRHGNNHAAAWFTNRESYYHVHDLGCDGLHDSSTYYCDPQHVHTKDEQNEVELLLDHNSVCKEASCTCSEVLSKLVPALT